MCAKRQKREKKQKAPDVGSKLLRRTRVAPGGEWQYRGIQTRHRWRSAGGRYQQ